MVGSAHATTFAGTHHPDQTATILAKVDLSEVAPVDPTDGEVADLLRFLESLTSPSLGTLAGRDTPDAVPSGLPLSD